jgi:hypothetical protein
VTQTRRYFVRLFSFALTTPEPRTRVHTHTQIGSWKKKIKKSCFKDPFEWEGKTKCFLGGKNQAGTAAAHDWVVVLTRRDTKRFHVTGSNTGCWLVVVVVVLRLFVGFVFGPYGNWMLAISSATRSSTGEERSRDDAHTGNLLTIVVGAGCADGQRRR